MQAIQMLVALGITLAAFPALSETHTVVGFLSMAKGSQPRLVVNPPSQGRFTLNIQNPRSIAQLMKRHQYSGLVRFEMSVLDQVGEEASVHILKIAPVRVRRVPLYDANWLAVPGGRG
jgi:hypothetical protein